MLYLLGVLIVVVGVAFSIAFHELGHFLPAKAFGVRVPKYMIGFGPTLWSRTRGETEYGIKAIPLGGSSDDRHVPAPQDDAGHDSGFKHRPIRPAHGRGPQPEHGRAQTGR